MKIKELIRYLEDIEKRNPEGEVYELTFIDMKGVVVLHSGGDIDVYLP